MRDVRSTAIARHTLLLVVLAVLVIPALGQDAPRSPTPAPIPLPGRLVEIDVNFSR